MRNENMKFQNWRALAETPYFNLMDNGLLELAVPDLDGIIDFHVHLGWTILLATKVDITVETEETQHNFLDNLAVDLSIYSGMNFYNERPNWGKEDYIPAALSVGKNGKHHTHTIPNIIREMKPLKIAKSVMLSLDIASSANSRRCGTALQDVDELVFYCAVHPKHRKREQLIEEYIELGAKGMKVHPELQMTSIDAPEMLSLVELWKNKSGGMPVLFHSGFNGFEPEKARRHANIDLYYPVAEVMEGTPCILGHSSMNQYKTAIEIAKRHSHVLLEVSGQPPAHLHEMMDRLGSERLLFGTDWPVYPQAITMTKVLMATEGNTKARNDILRDNALRILEAGENARPA